MSANQLSKSSNYRRIFFFFVLIALVFLIFVIYFIMGKVYIVLTPKEVDKQIEFSFIVDAKNQKSDFEKSIIPGKIIDLTNKYTIVIDKELIKKEANFEETGKSYSELYISKDILPSLLELSKLELEKKLKSVYNSNVNQEDFSSEDSIEIEIKDIVSRTDGILFNEDKLEFERDNLNEIKSDSLKLDYDISAKGYIFKDSDLQKIAIVKSKNLISNECSFLYLNDIPPQVNLEKNDLNNKKAYFKAKYSIHTAYKINNDLLDKSKIVGFDKGDLQNYYNNSSIIKETNISFEPVWIRNVPANPNNIKIEIIMPKIENKNETDTIENTNESNKDISNEKDLKKI